MGSCTESRSAAVPIIINNTATINTPGTIASVASTTIITITVDAFSPRVFVMDHGSVVLPEMLAVDHGKPGSPKDPGEGSRKRGSPRDAGGGIADASHNPGLTFAPLWRTWRTLTIQQN